MKITRCILFFSCFFLPLVVGAAEREIHCKAVSISDGDTFTCLHQHTSLKIRLQYIDAPESTQPFGNRAKQALAKLIFKKQVKLVSTGYDRYKRLLAVVYDERGQNINLKLVEQGMAWAYRQTQPIYQQAQQNAHAKRIGLWQDSNPIDPAQWRANKQSVSSPSLQKMPAPRPLGVDCRVQLSCRQMPDYATALRYFQQCGWQSLDGNHDGIPCNKLYRKARK